MVVCSSRVAVRRFNRVPLDQIKWRNGTPFSLSARALADTSRRLEPEVVGATLREKCRNLLVSAEMMLRKGQRARVANLWRVGRTYPGR